MPTFLALGEYTGWPRISSRVRIRYLMSMGISEYLLNHLATCISAVFWKERQVSTYFI